MPAEEKLYCGAITTQFKKELLEVYRERHEIATSEEESKISRAIQKWLTTGERSSYIDKLFTIDGQKNFPIWWSGFYIEDKSSKNPIQNMKNAALGIQQQGYSSLNIPLSNALKKQSYFWQSCAITKNFKWGDYLSKTYTQMALKKNPQYIGLFLNKDDQAFLKTFFFQTELDLINSHYKAINKTVTMYIFNIKDNCDRITALLDGLKQTKKITNITFICRDCNTTSLRKCIENYNEVQALNLQHSPIGPTAPVIDHNDAVHQVVAVGGRNTRRYRRKHKKTRKHK